MTLGGGIDEELLTALLADGVPRNQATVIAARAAGLGLTDNQIEFLGALTTDASGRFILNTFPEGIPIGGGPTVRPGAGSTIEDVIAFIQTSQGRQFVDNLFTEADEFDAAVVDYQTKLAEFQSGQEAYQDQLFTEAERKGLSVSQFLEQQIAGEFASEDLSALFTLADQTRLLATRVQDAQTAVAPDVAIEEGQIVPLTSEQFRLPQLDQLFALTATAPAQTTGARGAGFVQPGGPTPRQSAFQAASEAESAKFRTEVDLQRAEEQRVSERAAVQRFGRLGTARAAARPRVTAPTIFETVGPGAGPPAFQRFAERAGPTLRQEVWRLSAAQQLPFLRRRFKEQGPQARGEFRAPFNPPARFLIRR